MAIEVKNLSQLKLMRKAGLVVADTLKLLKQSAQIGMTTLELDEIAANNLAKHGATSSFLGYHGFPAVICASVNEEVVHGIPNKRKLVSGDVLLRCLLKPKLARVSIVAQAEIRWTGYAHLRL